MTVLSPPIPRRRLVSRRWLRRISKLIPFFLLVMVFPALALAQSGSPFDTVFTAIQTLFTGTVAKVASLIAIVVGGYQFAHGEPGPSELQPEQQEEALVACYQETYTNGSKPKRILLPVRHLQQWIEHNILLELAAAPFSKEDAQLVPEVGSCVDCPKRTGRNTLLFSDISANQPDSCSDPKCYAARIDAHVKQTVAAKPKLVQISTAYGKPAEGSPVIPRNKYVEIRHEKPKSKNDRDWPEYKSCKFTTEAIVTEGTEKGEMRKVCANPECPVDHSKRQQQQRNHADAAFKAEQEKRRREEAIAQTAGMRVLKAIGDAVPVWLMKRDQLFLAERLTGMLDERRLSVLIRQHGIGRPKDDAVPAKLLTAFLPKAEESKLGRILIETAILLSMHNQTDATKILRDAEHAYKVDVDAISAQVEQEFAAKEKAKVGICLTNPGWTEPNAIAWL
jgi:ParB family transcriptional regulator, chromosome partitioning protein